MEKRKFTKSVCVKNNAKTSCKIEFFPAEQWEDGSAGCFRLRVNRKWLTASNGKMYHDYEACCRIITQYTLGQVPSFEPTPHLPRGTRVSLPVGKNSDGSTIYSGAFTATEPIRGYDGSFYVACHSFHGTCFYSVSSLVIHPSKK